MLDIERETPAAVVGTAGDDDRPPSARRFEPDGRGVDENRAGVREQRVRAGRILGGDQPDVVGEPWESSRQAFVEPVILADMTLIGGDDLHPTAQGYQVIADTFFKVIKDTLEQPAPAIR